MTQSNKAINEIPNYCPKCGEKLQRGITKNDDDHYVWTLASPPPVNRGETKESYDRETGERLYRVESFCPTRDKKKFLFWVRDYGSHYVVVEQWGLRKDEAKKRLNDNRS